MPFDGNGNWTSNFSAVADRDANIKILASRFDGILLADIAQSFENCLTKDTQVKPQQPFNANNYRIINVSNPVNATDAVNLQTVEGKDALCVHKAGTETITGDKTFSGSNTFSNTITGSITGNAGTVTNGVYTTGNQTIGGTKTFSSTISGSITGNAGTVTNGVYTTGNQTIGGTKTFSSTISGSITGNAGTVTNGVYTNTDQTITGNKTFTGTNTFVTPSATDSSTKAATTEWFDLPDVKKKFVGYSMPNYSSKLQIASGSSGTYTPTKDGWIWIQARFNNRTAKVSIDTYEVFNSDWSASYGVTDNSFIPVAKNKEISWTSSNSSLSIWFFTCIGE